MSVTPSIMELWVPQKWYETKEEAFANYPHTYDPALPQAWINEFAAWCTEQYPEVTYDLIRSTTVIAYPQRGYCRPVTVNKDVAEAFAYWDRSRGQTYNED